MRALAIAFVAVVALMLGACGGPQTGPSTETETVPGAQEMAASGEHLAKPAAPEPRIAPPSSDVAASRPSPFPSPAFGQGAGGPVPFSPAAPSSVLTYPAQPAPSPAPGGEALTPRIGAWLPTPGQVQPGRNLTGRRVVVNQVPLTRDQYQRLEMLEMQNGFRAPDGQYWYDNLSGMWGLWAGPALGYLAPGLALGGPLGANASGGGSGMLTGIFINGRELHPQDAAQLRTLTSLPPGRYWLDGQGNLGREGEPALVNLRQVIQQMTGSGSQSTSWSHGVWAPGGTDYVGGDDRGFTYFMGSDGTSVYVGD